METPNPQLTDLSNLHCVISQKIVQYHLAGISKHAVCVIPKAVESQDMTVMVKELFQVVSLLIRSQGLHAFFQLNETIVSID